MMTEIKQACSGKWKCENIKVCVWMCACFFVCCLRLSPDQIKVDAGDRARGKEWDRDQIGVNILSRFDRKRKRPGYSINHLPLAHICLSQFLSCSTPFYILMLDSCGLLQTRPKFNENSVEQANMLSRSCLAQMSPPAQHLCISAQFAIPLHLYHAHRYFMGAAFRQLFPSRNLDDVLFIKSLSTEDLYLYE